MSKSWQPSASPEAIHARAVLLATIREFFAARGVLEVETPVLSAAGNSDPGISQMMCATGRYLRTSPEYPLKRMLAAGHGDIYEMGRVFRADEYGRLHNPEFTLLEWYRVGWDYHQLMSEAAELVNHCGARFGMNWPVSTISYASLFEQLAGINPIEVSEKSLQDRALQYGLETGTADTMTRDELLDLILSHQIQPAMDDSMMTLVHDYPSSQAALARIRDDNPPVAERFELYLGGVELANGYQELLDDAELAHRFRTENEKRQQKVPLDQNLLDAQEAGLPDCTGVALGVDRLLMACMGAQHLDEVIAFPSERA